MALTGQNQWAQIIAAKTRNTINGGYLFNNRYRGDAATAVSVLIPATSKKKAAAYNKNDITQNKIGSHENEWIPMNVDKDYSIIDLVDGYDANTLPYDVKRDELEESARAFLEQEEADGITALVNAVAGNDVNGAAFADTARKGKKGTTIASGKALSAADPYKVLTDIGAAMTKKGVPLKDRYAVVDADVYAAILNSDKAIRQGDLAQKLVQDGVVAQLAGFNIYVSQFLPAGTGILAGHADFATRAEAFRVEPMILDASSTDAQAVGGVFIKGRIVYAHGVTNPEAFVAWTYTVA